jgi:Tol biopolymer transport system component
VLVLLGVTVAVAVGFVRMNGPGPRDESGPSALFPQGAAIATKDKIAFTDDLGRLQAVAADAGKPEVIANCRASPPGDRPSTVLRRTACQLLEPAWSPDGRAIAFVSGSMSVMRGDPSWHITFSLYLREAGGSVRRLTDCGSCGHEWGGRLSWSPDGSWIAFSRGSAYGPQSLWAVHTADGTLRRLTDCQLCADVGPDWAPSGQLIVFSRAAKRGGGLYTVRPDGSQLTKITAGARPQWSPDGSKIAFDGSDKIFIVGADGSDQKLLLDGARGSGPGNPSWSPDGRKLAFSYTPGRSGHFTAEVWTMAADGAKKRRLYHSACCVASYTPPVWSPDGTKIAFAANSAGGTFVVAADGTGLRRLSGAPANGITWQRLP